MTHCLRFWQALGLLGLWLLAAGPARAQTPDSTNVLTPDSTVVDNAGSFTPPPAGLPSPEFETYNVAGSGVRYTGALTGLLTTGTVERLYLSTSHTGNLATKRHWLFPAAFNYTYGRQNGGLRERELLLLTTPAYRRGKWKYYLLAELETSNLRAIANRVVAGGGLGYQLYQRHHQQRAGPEHLPARRAHRLRHRARAGTAACCAAAPA